MAEIVIDALGIIGGNLVLEEARGFDPGEEGYAGAEDLEEMVQLPELEKAEEFRKKSLIWDILPDETIVPYSILKTDTSVLGKYGVGLELYFLLLKELTLIFFIISLISIWPIVENFYGDGLQEGDSASAIDRVSVGNQEGVNTYDPDLTLEEAESKTDTISDNVIRIASADFIYSLIFLGFTVHYFLISQRVIKRNYKENVTAGDYSLQVKGMPKDLLDPRVIHDHFKQFGDVSEVSLARKYNDLLDDYVKRANLSYDLGYELRRIEKLEAKSAEKATKLQKKIDKFDNKIAKHETARLKHEELPVDRAYIIFNQLKARKECLKAYTKHKSYFKRKKNQPINLKLNGEYHLRVREATEPSNIHWENLEVTHKSRIIRRTISAIISVIILLLSITLIYYLKTIEDELPTDEECNTKGVTDIPLADAQVQYTSTKEIYCYCKQLPFGDLFDDDDTNEFCSDYIDANTQATLIRIVGSFGVVAINFVLKLILRKLSIFERMSTKTQEQMKIMSKVFIAMFINTAIITLIVNADFSDTVITEYLPQYIFNGKFYDFTRSWYAKVGATITLTLLISVVSPHFVNLLIRWPMDYVKRKGCWKRYKTQHELNLAFAGANFDLSTKISQVLNVVFSSFFYSGGIPLLNISCFVTMFCIYWCDKILVLRYYSRPPLYSSALNDKVIQILPMAIVLHSCISLWMYGAETIFPTGFHVSDGTIIADDESIGDRISRPAGIMMMIVFCLSFLLYIWGVPISKWLNKKFFKNKVYSETRKGQGSYLEEIVSIKEFGIHSYNILENKMYRPLVMSLNATAEEIRKKEAEENGEIAGNEIEENQEARKQNDRGNEEEKTGRKDKEVGKKDKAEIAEPEEEIKENDSEKNVITTKKQDENNEITTKKEGEEEEITTKKEEEKEEITTKKEGEEEEITTKKEEENKEA